MSDYKPVTVEAAIRLADHFEKDIVVIFTIDHAHGLCHYTTFGRSPADKLNAARYGDAVANIISAEELSKKQNFEDFRLLDAATHKAHADVLRHAAESVVEALRGPLPVEPANIIALLEGAIAEAK